MNADERRNLYVSFLSAEGFRPRVDADGDIDFKVEGGNYYIDIDPDDDEFFRVVYPNFWEINGEQDLLRALIAVDHANRSSKVVKLYVRSDGKNVSASLEVFVDRPEHFRYIFARCMSALKYGVKTYLEKIAAD